MHVFFSIFPCLTHTTEVVSTFSSLTGWAVLLFLSPCCLIGINRDLIVLFHISSPSFKQTKSCVHEKKHWHTTKKKKTSSNYPHHFKNPAPVIEFQPTTKREKQGSLHHQPKQGTCLQRDITQNLHMFTLSLIPLKFGSNLMMYGKIIH